MLIHAENEEPKIRVILKSQEEVLSTINYSLEALMVYSLNIPGTVDGRYTSWADFMSVMNNPGKKRKIYGDLLSLKNTAKIQNFTSNVAVLTSVFKTEIDENTIWTDNFGHATQEECQMIKDIMNKGVYL